MKKFNIAQFRPCSSARHWYNQQPSTEAAWNNCSRGDWMLWIAVRIGIDKRLLVLTAAYCAKTVYHLMSEEARDAVVAAINYGRGKIGGDELKDAADAAAYAADAAYAAARAAYAADAAYAAARAAYAAARAVDAAARAAANAAVDTDVAEYAAADTAARAAIDAAYDNAIQKNQQQTADICRKYLTDVVFEKIKEEQ